MCIVVNNVSLQISVVVHRKTIYCVLEDMHKKLSFHLLDNIHDNAFDTEWKDMYDRIYYQTKKNFIKNEK
jgi:hypothetical protein